MQIAIVLIQTQHLLIFNPQSKTQRLFNYHHNDREMQ